MGCVSEGGWWHRAYERRPSEGRVCARAYALVAHMASQPDIPSFVLPDNYTSPTWPSLGTSTQLYLLTGARARVLSRLPNVCNERGHTLKVCLLVRGCMASQTCGCS